MKMIPTTIVPLFSVCPWDRMQKRTDFAVVVFPFFSVDNFAWHTPKPIQEKLLKNAHLHFIYLNILILRDQNLQQFICSKIWTVRNI